MSERESLERQLNFARGLQIETRILEGTDVAEAVVDYARLHSVSQIFVTRQRDNVMSSWFTEGLVQRIVYLAGDMQVTIVADRTIRR